jgi:hypothetical protein
MRLGRPEQLMQVVYLSRPRRELDRQQADRLTLRRDQPLECAHGTLNFRDHLGHADCGMLRGPRQTIHPAHHSVTASRPSPRSPSSDCGQRLRHQQRGDDGRHG